ncbi:MAG: 1-(5-phosphoribosyl)-5-((5-phosphoribosylamino)methylideneamino)imidazole-4-carboxamide isomerase [Alicyclobacillaceae bacterium]|nr:1-(5-phosphoribosyl)-5-((5-phosphoribosylamino)methylideneamino)imidazole-4-carboxamide isomerase [Alicyclobacillaceae bacterium]
MRDQSQADGQAGFDLIPAIDILGGACVRLFKGDYAAKTEYAADPRVVAERWLEQGASWLHVVDLDGARSGSAVNAGVIGDVVRLASQAGARVQVGGGIRHHDAVARWLDHGVARCVIGTAALDTAWMEQAVARFGGDALVAGLDGRGGKVAVRGWLEQTEADMAEVAIRLAAVGVRWALVTDVDRDGTLGGANIALAQEVQRRSGLRAIASGGVRGVDDVLAALQAGLAGAIAGRSLYDGTLDLREALAAVRRAVAGGLPGDQAAGRAAGPGAGRAVAGQPANGQAGKEAGPC